MQNDKTKMTAHREDDDLQRLSYTWRGLFYYCDIDGPVYNFNSKT